MNTTSVKKCLNIRKNGYHRWFFINLPAFIGSNNEFYSAFLNTEIQSCLIEKMGIVSLNPEQIILLFYQW